MTQYLSQNKLGYDEKKRKNVSGMGYKVMIHASPGAIYVLKRSC